MNDSFKMFIDKNIKPEEMAELMDSVGWGKKKEYNHRSILRSLSNFPFVAYIRNEDNELVGYVSAFSDGAFSTFVSELVIHPGVQNQGLGSELLQAVEREYCGIPIYIKHFDDSKDFFIKHGYTEPKRKMSVLSKRNEF